jgi:hypothetical protein
MTAGRSWSSTPDGIKQRNDESQKVENDERGMMNGENHPPAFSFIIHHLAFIISLYRYLSAMNSRM